ncbi:MAG: hypothetical protein J6B87_01075 [Clostridia bacterium]|nr:hypothetical protein [Clostridia bacterium]
MSYAIINFKERKTFFDTISIDEVCEEVKVNVPKFKEKTSERYGKKISKILKKYKVSNVVLNNELQKNELFKNILNENNNYIISGKRMYKVLLPTIIKETSKIMEMPVEKLNVAILADEYNIDNLDLIKYLSDIVKHVTLVTNNAYKFQKLVDELLHYNGISVRLLNKGKHTLKRENYIINVDFDAESLSKIIVPVNSIVITIPNEQYPIKKNFNGIVINDLNIYLNQDNENFSSLSLCEAYIYNYMKKIKENELLFNRSKYHINGYIGNNGLICQEDFERLGKIFQESKK